MQPITRAAAAIVCAFLVAACVDSSDALLKDARPLFGQELQLQFYTMRNGFADEPEEASYKWDGAQYAHAGGGMDDVSAFSVHPIGSEVFVVQSISNKRPQIVEYAVARMLTEGVYQVAAIDEDDAPRPMRARLCKRSDGSVCRVESRAALLQFARATARHRRGQGGLVLRLAHQAPRSSR